MSADRRPVVAAVATAVLVPVLGTALPGYWVFLATSATIYALIALSVGVVHGRAGMLALCPMAFAGIGAWTVGWLELHTGLPVLVSMLLGALAAVPVGVAIGLPALRLRGVNLAVATLAFGGALAVVTFDRGFPGAIEQRPVTRPWFAESETGYFLLTAAALAVVGVLLARASRSGLGASWTAVRDSERATAALGHSVVTTKLLAFAVSAFVAGLGGALLAGQLGILSGVGFQPFASLVVFTAAVAFGSAHVAGAVLAGVAAVFLPEALRQLGLPQDVAPGLFAVAALQALAGGEGGVAGTLRERFRPAAPADPVVPSAAPTGVAQAADPVSAPRTLPAGGPRLEVRDVGVSYGAVRALDGVDLVVRAGTVHGLIGPNGAGKSTLIDVVSGFVTPTRGEVLLAGEAMAAVPPHRRARRGVRRSFQQGRVSPELSIGQYLVLSGRGRADRDLVEELLDAFGCPPAATTVGTLDVGARRLVEVAATLASRPAVVLLDEPAAGLAAAESARLAAVVAEVPERFDSAVLLVEHDIEMVVSCCDEVTALDFGRVVSVGPPRAVLRDPAVLRSYLGTGDDLEVARDAGTA
jgi:branched-chain amino acid transport system permease protein